MEGPPPSSPSGRLGGEPCSDSAPSRVENVVATSVTAASPVIGNISTGVMRVGADVRGAVKPSNVGPGGEMLAAPLGAKNLAEPNPLLLQVRGGGLGQLVSGEAKEVLHGPPSASGSAARGVGGDGQPRGPVATRLAFGQSGSQSMTSGTTTQTGSNGASTGSGSVASGNSLDRCARTLDSLQSTAAKMNSVSDRKAPIKRSKPSSPAAPAAPAEASAKRRRVADADAHAQSPTAAVVAQPTSIPPAAPASPAGSAAGVHLKPNHQTLLVQKDMQGNIVSQQPLYLTLAFPPAPSKSTAESDPKSGKASASAPSRQPTSQTQYLYLNGQYWAMSAPPPTAFLVGGSGVKAGETAKAPSSGIATRDPKANRYSTRPVWSSTGRDVNSSRQGEQIGWHQMDQPLVEMPPTVYTPQVLTDARGAQGVLRPTAPGYPPTVYQLAPGTANPQAFQVIGMGNMYGGRGQRGAGAKRHKPYACNMCEKRFVTKSSLVRHSRIHNGKAFVCPECKKPFCDANYLSIHMRIHTGEKPYECPTCGRRFSQRGNFQRHQLIHKRKQNRLLQQQRQEKERRECEERQRQQRTLLQSPSQSGLGSGLGGGLGGRLGGGLGGVGHGPGGASAQEGGGGVGGSGASGDFDSSAALNNNSFLRFMSLNSL